MKKSAFFASAIVAFLFFVSCGGEKKNESEKTEKDSVTTAVPDTSAEPEATNAEFTCTVNGQLFKYDTKNCLERPDFKRFEFSFYNGSEAVHIGIDQAEKDKTVPFTLELNQSKETASYFGFEPVPDIFSTPVEKNTITVTEWDQANKVISFTFKGDVTDVDNTRTFKMEGSANKLKYE